MNKTLELKLENMGLKKLPVKIVEYVNAVLTSSHNRIKITTNYRTAIMGSRLKSSRTEVLHLGTHRRGHFKTSRRGGDTEWTGPTPACGSWESGGISSCGSTPGGAWGPNSTPGYQYWEERSPQFLVVKTSRDCGSVRWRAAGLADISLKGPTRTDLLAIEFTLSSSAWAAVQKVLGTSGDKLNSSDFRERAERASFSQTEVLAECFVSLLSSLQPGVQTQVPPYLSLNQPGYPALVLPWDPAPPSLRAHLSCFQWIFHINGLS